MIFPTHSCFYIGWMGTSTNLTSGSVSHNFDRTSESLAEAGSSYVSGSVSGDNYRNAAVSINQYSIVRYRSSSGSRSSRASSASGNLGYDPDASFVQI